MRPAEPVILVTGATGGLGRVAVEAFAADGARLGLAGRDAGRLAAAGDAAGLSPGCWVPAVGDLTDPGQAAAAVDAVVERFGRVDVVLHLVGGWTGGTPVTALDPAVVRGMLDQHLWTTLNVVQAVVPGMVERGWGRVVVVSSPVATDPGAKTGPYAVAKAAEETLVRTLARELGDSGVTANVVVVRSIDTAHERETSPGPRSAAATTPEEIVDVLRFLASDAAASVNGARIPLHGR